MKADKIKYLGFKLSIAILLLALLGTYGVYWRGINLLHDHIAQLISASDHLRVGEGFHSALHSMLMAAEGYIASGGEKTYLEEYERQATKASTLVARLSTQAGELDLHDSGASVRQLTDGIAEGFAKFKGNLDKIFAGEPAKARQRLKAAGELFDQIFKHYYSHIHDHHNVIQDELQGKAHATWLNMTTMFVIQLVLAVLAGLLVLLYFDRVILKVFIFNERMALHDKLTGLYNRLSLEQIALSLDKECDPEKTRYGVIMLDIDYFKGFNDSFGHQAGDKVLADLAEILKKSVRSQDRVVRYGGEEFLVYVFDAEKRGLSIVAEKLRASIEANIFRLPNGSEAEGITASLGAAVYPEDGQAFNEIVKRADEQLYLAKTGGRNRVKGTA